MVCHGSGWFFTVPGGFYGPARHCQPEAGFSLVMMIVMVMIMMMKMIMALKNLFLFQYFKKNGI